MTTTLIEGKDGKLYSDAFLSEIRELNQTLFKTVRATLERTPFADCRQTLKDYLRLYEDTEARYDIKSTNSIVPSSKRTSDVIIEASVPAKNVKFANGAATVVIKEEEQETVKTAAFNKSATVEIRSDLTKIDNGNTNSVPSAFSASAMHRATGTSSLLAPLPLTFHFKPTTASGSSDSSHGTSTATVMPQINTLSNQSSESTRLTPLPSNAPPKFAFTLPASVAPATATTVSTASSTSQGLPTFSFFSAVPFPPKSSNIAASSAGGAAGDEGEADADADEDETPPEPETIEVREEGAIYSKPCQLLFRIVGDKEKTMHEKGAGVLFLKKVETGVQLLVRASNVLRTVLLNVLLTKQLPLNLQGKQSVRLVCAPNPPVASTGTAKVTLAEFFFKCDSSTDAQELHNRLQQERQSENEKS